MYRIRLHYDTPGWAYYNRCMALYKYRPKDFEVSLALGNVRQEYPKTDLALQLCYSHIEKLREDYRHSGSNPIIVAGINIGNVATNKRWIRYVLKYADAVVVNSKLCYDSLPKNSKTHQISNGVDLDQFRPKISIAHRTWQQPKILWTGSLFHRKTKGYDEFLQPIAQEFHKEGIKCDFRLVDSHGGPSQLVGEELVDWYNSGNIYLVTSETEGTPNPAIEASACGCTVVSTKVGNMPELIKDGINGFLVNRNYAEICVALRLAVKKYLHLAESMGTEIKRNWSWEKRADEYYNLFRRLLNERRA